MSTEEILEEIFSELRSVAARLNGHERVQHAEVATSNGNGHGFITGEVIDFLHSLKTEQGCRLDDSYLYHLAQTLVSGVPGPVSALRC